MRGLQLEEVALVHRLPDDLVHVVGLGRAVRDDRVQRWLDPVPVVRRRALGHRRPVVLGQEVHEVARREQRLDIVVEGDVRHA